MSKKVILMNGADLPPGMIMDEAAKELDSTRKILIIMLKTDEVPEEISIHANFLSISEWAFISLHMQRLALTAAQGSIIEG